MKGADKLSQAHLDALSILIRPLVECKNGEPISSLKASKILYEWDQARKVKEITSEDAADPIDIVKRFIDANWDAFTEHCAKAYLTEPQALELYNNLNEHKKLNDKLENLFKPRFWGKKEQEAWHRNIPTLINAFAALRETVK